MSNSFRVLLQNNRGGPTQTLKDLVSMVCQGSSQLGHTEVQVTTFCDKHKLIYKLYAFLQMLMEHELKTTDHIPLLKMAKEESILT